MTTIEDVLRVYGKGLQVDEFAERLAKALRGRVGPDPRALSEHDRQVLSRIGVPAADLDAAAPAGALAVVDAAAELMAEESSMLPAAAVADRLGRSAVRIRGAIADGSLYGVKVGRSWLLPTWQLTDSASPLPHLRAVIASIPQGVSATAMQRIMTQPSSELFLDGQAVSPREWLMAGQDAGPVTELITHLYAW